MVVFIWPIVAFGAEKHLRTSVWPLWVLGDDAHPGAPMGPITKLNIDRPVRPTQNIFSMYIRGQRFCTCIFKDRVVAHIT